jgi:hypothetical protein
MPAPTDLLNDDLKELKADAKGLREDLHKVEVALTKEIQRVEVALKEEVHGVDNRLTVLSTQVKGMLSGIRTLAVLTLASVLSGVWWGATITSKVDALEKRFARFEAKVDARFDKLEASFDARFEKLEASIARVLEQTKPTAK